MVNFKRNNFTQKADFRVSYDATFFYVSFKCNPLSCFCGCMGSYALAWVRTHMREFERTCVSLNAHAWVWTHMREFGRTCVSLNAHAWVWTHMRDCTPGCVRSYLRLFIRSCVSGCVRLWGSVSNKFFFVQNHLYNKTRVINLNPLKINIYKNEL